MNSGELKVDVPLASIESDCEDPVGDGSSLVNTPSKNIDNKLKSSDRGVATKKLSPLPRLEGGDSLTGSLEDLVNSFDEKLTMCFQDYQEQVDKIAPVQVSSIHFGFLCPLHLPGQKKLCPGHKVLSQAKKYTFAGGKD